MGKIVHRGETSTTAKIAALHNAALKGDWITAKPLFEENEKLIRTPITEGGEIALHIAALKGHQGFVTKLLDKMEIDDVATQNAKGCTALYFAATAGHTHIAQLMLNKISNLANIKGDEGVWPLNMAVLHGFGEMAELLYSSSDMKSWTPLEKVNLLTSAIKSGLYGLAIKIVDDDQSLALTKDGDGEGEGETPLQVLVQKRLAFSCDNRRGSWDNIRKIVVCMKKSKTHEKDDPYALLHKLWDAGAANNEQGHTKSGDIGSRDTGAGYMEGDTKAGDIVKENIGAGYMEGDTKAGDIVKENIGAGDIGDIEAGYMEGDKVGDIEAGYGYTERYTEGDIGAGVIGAGDIELAGSTERYTKGYTKAGDIELAAIGAAEIQAAETEAAAAIGVAEIEAADFTKLFSRAAEMGNDDFLMELLRKDHNQLYKVNESNHTIFHVAVLFRSINVFNLMFELGSTKDLIATYVDDQGNNMLHLAGKLAPRDKLDSISGAAMQMQREVLWFKEVEKLVPDTYRNKKNSKEQTPHELFLAEHKDLMKEAEKFMKQTAKSCMLVAILIATVVFAAAFTVPGGYNNSTGVPILMIMNTKMFVVFQVSEAAAMLSSLISIIMSLSILMSRYSDEDFLKKLPSWLVVGVSMLFFSIVAMMVAFCMCLLFFEHQRLKVMLFLVFFACVPTMFAVLKYPLLVTILRCTYSSTWLFRSDNRLHSKASARDAS